MYWWGIEWLSRVLEGVVSQRYGGVSKERNEVIAVRRLRDTYCRRGDVGEVELKRVGRERWKRICG